LQTGGMAFPQHPFRPFLRAVESIARRLGDLRLWLPFLVLGAFKGLLLCGLARIDLVPTAVVDAMLTAAPGMSELLRYPDLMLDRPDLARDVDLALFVTLGAFVHGWAIVHLARTWTGEPVPFLPGARQGAARLGNLLLLSTCMAAAPMAARLIAHAVGEAAFAPMGALAVGLVAQALLFMAAAFVVLDGGPLWRNVQHSVFVLGAFPLAVPAAILFQAALHAPALALRSPALVAGADRNPDWILAALLAQIPADLLGAFFAAGFAARYALSSQVREIRRQHA
jgi:hypothetical protein